MIVDGTKILFFWLSDIYLLFYLKVILRIFIIFKVKKKELLILICFKEN